MRIFAALLTLFFAATATAQDNSCFPYCFKCNSIKLALAVAESSRREPKGLRDNAVAEVTLNNFDTARVMTPISAGSRTFVAVLKCRASEVTEAKEAEQFEQGDIQ